MTPTSLNVALAQSLIVCYSSVMCLMSILGKDRSLYIAPDIISLSLLPLEEGVQQHNVILSVLWSKAWSVKVVTVQSVKEKILE